MSCIAGSVERPRPWIRFAGGEPQELEGRWCDRTEPYTNRRKCSSCPAYRGVRYDGSVATGCAPNGDPIGLTVPEYADWRDAQEEALLEDDFSLLASWQERMNGGLGERALRDIGDPDASDRWASYMRDYRDRNPEYVDRNREQSRERMRRYRLRKQPESPSTGQGR